MKHQISLLWRVQRTRFPAGKAAIGMCAAIVLWSLSSWVLWIATDVRLTAASATTTGLVVRLFYEGNSMAGAECNSVGEDSTDKFFVVYRFTPTGAGEAENSVLQTEEVGRGLYCRLLGSASVPIHYLPTDPQLAAIDRYW